MMGIYIYVYDFKYIYIHTDMYIYICIHRQLKMCMCEAHQLNRKEAVIEMSKFTDSPNPSDDNL